jgi:hypothetical protein
LVIRLRVAMRRLGFLLLALSWLAACGRTALRLPADRPDTASTPDAPPDSRQADAPLGADLRPSDPPADPRDTDASSPEDLARADAPSPVTACRALAHLADQGVLIRQRTRQVTFAPDRSWVALKVRSESPPGTSLPDQLLHVALPSGEVTVVSTAGGTALALGSTGGLLVIAGEDVVVYENRRPRTLASRTCVQLATPDGARLYVMRDCASGRGTLDVIDVASGTATTLARNVSTRAYWTPDFSVSPSGRYFAFVAPSPDGGDSDPRLHVADRDGKVYVLAAQRGAAMPWFVSDELLLFGANTEGFPTPAGRLWAHVPGSGDTSYPLARAGIASGSNGYKVSADRRWLLGVDDLHDDAGWGRAGLLYAIALDGSGERLLASTLVPFWLYEMAFDSFGWSGDGEWAICQAKPTGVWAISPRGAASAQLASSGWGRTAPVGDWVALIEDNRLRVLALGTMQEIFSLGTEGSLAAPNFTPDARGLLFVNAPTSGAHELRYFSAAQANSVVLGAWTETLLDTYRVMTDPLGRYPVDPTGCFTVVDTDLAPGPGTRLVLLPM